ncbi:hypothetical protein CYLTODRAFT_487766 [Cylindrobasidium torrendii FP15055 ss-10]|uniref:Zn(2)-C6 fungal-type domain-containing protein n=1 Tax=Cylindrobasidium torrendii FP15055 ss-10 TaxID=1314674 RepID=A0A0D7BK85_9AGAR|nr:hypothetical protein CYLTODRAFT_487766 [Cylindrobasidium torrendii FP15055 ss-10]
MLCFASPPTLMNIGHSQYYDGWSDADVAGVQDHPLYGNNLSQTRRSQFPTQGYRQLPEAESVPISSYRPLMPQSWHPPYGNAFEDTASASSLGAVRRRDAFSPNADLYGTNAREPSPYGDSTYPSSGSFSEHRTLPSPPSATERQRPRTAGSLDTPAGMLFRTPDHPRLRTAQACEKCRVRKAKCSGEHPSCKRCTTRGLVCEYAKEGRVRGPNKSKKPSVTRPNSDESVFSGGTSKTSSRARKQADDFIPGDFSGGGDSPSDSSVNDQLSNRSSPPAGRTRAPTLSINTDAANDGSPPANGHLSATTSADGFPLSAVSHPGTSSGLHFDYMADLDPYRYSHSPDERSLSCPQSAASLAFSSHEAPLTRGYATSPYDYEGVSRQQQLYPNYRPFEGEKTQFDYDYLGRPKPINHPTDL